MTHNEEEDYIDEEEYNFWVATKYTDSSKCFHSRIEAIMYFDSLNEEAVLWDYSAHEDGEKIRYK